MQPIKVDDTGCREKFGWLNTRVNKQDTVWPGLDLEEDGGQHVLDDGQYVVFRFIVHGAEQYVVPERFRAQHLPRLPDEVGELVDEDQGEGEGDDQPVVGEEYAHGGEVRVQEEFPDRHFAEVGPVALLQAGQRRHVFHDVYLEGGKGSNKVCFFFFFLSLDTPATMISIEKRYLDVRSFMI